MTLFDIAEKRGSKIPGALFNQNFAGYLVNLK